MFYASQVICYNQKNINDYTMTNTSNICQMIKESLGEQDQTLFTSSIKKIKNFEVCL